MKRHELEALREKVSCEAVLERNGWTIDMKESTRRAVKYRHGGQIIIVTHEGRGWFNPLGDEKGDVFSLAMFIENLAFSDAADEIASLVGTSLSRPPWKPQPSAPPQRASTSAGRVDALHQPDPMAGDTCIMIALSRPT